MSFVRRATAVLVLGAIASAQKTTRASSTPAGASANGQSFQSALSSNGRFVAFASQATDLVANDTNLRRDIFVRDRWVGANELASVATNGAQAAKDCQFPAISGDGRFVAFQSFAGNLVANDLNNVEDVFLRDRASGTLSCVSVDANGNPGAGGPTGPLFPFEPACSVSRDGRFTAFSSSFTNLVASDTNAAPDIFVRDRVTGTTVRVDVDAFGVEGNGGARWPSISADGRFVAFQSAASNLVPGDTNGGRDIFVYELATGMIERANVSTAGVQANGDGDRPSLSADGRFVAFACWGTSLVAGDSNQDCDIFVRDRASGVVVRASVDSSNSEGQEGSYDPWISGNGRYVTFWSRASNLVPMDSNGREDVFVHDLVLGTTWRASLDANDQQSPSICARPSMSEDGRWVSFETYAALAPGDANGNQDVYVRDVASSQPATYCQSKLNSAGCAPGIAFNGSPSASGAGVFTISASWVLNQKPGLLFYGSTAIVTPYHGGTLCVGSPLRRTAPQSSGGTALPAQDCSGAFTLDFNARIASGVDPSLIAGAIVHCQYWYRDGAQPPGQKTDLTDAGFFEIAP